MPNNQEEDVNSARPLDQTQSNEASEFKFMEDELAAMTKPQEPQEEETIPPMNEEIEVKKDKGKSIVHVKSGKRIYPKNSDSKKGLPSKCEGSSPKRKAIPFEVKDGKSSIELVHKRSKRRKYSAKLDNLLKVKNNSDVSSVSGYRNLVFDGDIVGKIKKVVHANGKVTHQIAVPKGSKLVSQSKTPVQDSPESSEIGSNNKPSTSKEYSEEWDQKWSDLMDGEFLDSGSRIQYISAIVAQWLCIDLPDLLSTRLKTKDNRFFKFWSSFDKITICFALNLFVEVYNNLMVCEFMKVCHNVEISYNSSLTSYL